jgi:hypothetical protein
MKDRITILTGAGLTASSDFFGITTLGLTQSFISYNHIDLTDDKDFMKFVYEEFCFWNNLAPTNIQGNLNQINFETILQIIEELFAYIEDVERTNHKVKHQNSVKNTVFSLNRRLLQKINRARVPKWKDGTYFFIEKVYNHLIDRIIDDLVEHNENALNKGMTGFKVFIDDNFEQRKFTRRIYTLNYDNWLNKNAGYFDGFVTDEFNSKEVIADRDTDCHYNLHGCILWQRQMTCKKLEIPEERKHFQSFGGYNIAREAVLPSPIISGYNKLTRINESPLLEIFHSLTSDCLSANKLLVIGYSFSDPHVNNNFRLLRKAVRVIVVIFCTANALIDTNSDFHRLVYELQDIFLTTFTNPQIRTGLQHTIDCDDKKVSIFINGVGQSFYDEFPQI